MLSIRSRCELVAIIIMLMALGARAAAQERLWVHSTTGGYLDSSAALADVDRDGSLDIVINSTAGVVLALDARGNTIWETDLEDRISVAPTVADVIGDPGLEVLVLTQTGRLVCLEGLTGDLVWEDRQLGDVKWAAMAVIVADLDRDGSLEILAGDQAGKLLCLAADGETLWTYEESEGIGSAPAVGDLDADGSAEIVIVTPETPLVCLDHDGNVRWRMAEKTDTWESRLKRESSGPVIWDLDTNGRSEILVGIGNALVAVTGDGEVMWTHPMSNQVDSAISVADADGDGEDEVYAADLSGKFVCVTASGKQKWAASLTKRARRSPTIADVDGDGVVEILAAGYGEELAVFAPDGTVEERLVVNAGTNAAAALGDLLGDGSLCAVIPEISGDLVVYHWGLGAASSKTLWPGYRFNATRSASPYPHVRRATADNPERVVLGDYYANSAVFEVSLGKTGREGASLHLDITRDGQPFAHWEGPLPAQGATARLPYAPAELAGTQARFSYAVMAGRETITRHNHTVEVFPFVREWESLDSMIDEIRGLIPSLPDSGGVVEQVCYLRSRVDDLHEKATPVAAFSPLERRALRADLLELGHTISRPLAIARQAVNEGKVLAVYAANPWAPFGGMDEIVEGRAPASVVATDAGAVSQIAGFHGEVESSAVNVFNFGDSAMTLRVTVEGLVCEAGGDARHGDDAVTLREVVSVPTQRMDKSADALPLLGQGSTLVVPAWEGRQLWVTVDTAGLSPGTWTGRLLFRSLDVPSRECSANLAITVWETPLPEEAPLFFCNWSATDKPKGALEDLVAHGTNVFRGGIPGSAKFDEHGDIVGEIDYTAHDEFMKRHAPHGVVLFHDLASLNGPAPKYSPVWQKAYNQFIERWTAHLADLGFGYDDFALYPVDEPGLDDGRRVEAFVQSAKAAREADPNIRTYANPVGHITIEQLRRMAPYVSIWAPLHAAGWTQDEPEKLAFMHETGAELWNYSCSHDAKHQSPLGYYRGQAWMVWSLGHTGIGFYTYHRNGDAAWFFQIGDYDMVYEGDGVVTSKRWEAVRDGVEDYTMLHCLRQAAAAKGVDSDALKEAQRVCGEEAEAIGRFCNWGENETVPGKEGMPGARLLADEQWKKLQATREDMARLLALLSDSP